VRISICARKARPSQGGDILGAGGFPPYACATPFFAARHLRHRPPFSAIMIVGALAAREFDARRALAVEQDGMAQRVGNALKVPPFEDFFAAPGEIMLML
jgi:hypothetical protein